MGQCTIRVLVVLCRVFSCLCRLLSVFSVVSLISLLISRFISNCAGLAALTYLLLFGHSTRHFSPSHMTYLTFYGRHRQRFFVHSDC